MNGNYSEHVELLCRAGLGKHLTPVNQRTVIQTTLFWNFKCTYHNS